MSLCSAGVDDMAGIPESTFLRKTGNLDYRRVNGWRENASGDSLEVYAVCCFLSLRPPSTGS